MKNPAQTTARVDLPDDPPDPPTLYLYDDDGVPVFAGDDMTLYWQGNGSDRQDIYTFDANDDSFALFDGSLPPYSIESTGTVLTVRSGADPALYRVRYTSSASGTVRGTINVKRVTDPGPRDCDK